MRISKGDADARRPRGRACMGKKRYEFAVRPGSRPRLRNYDAAYTGGFDEARAAEKFDADTRELAELQDRLMARESHALLVVFQSIDGSGKDGTIKAVASRL